MQFYAYYSYTCDQLIRKVGGNLAMAEVEVEDAETKRKFKEIVAICNFAFAEPAELKAAYPDLKCVGRFIKVIQLGDNGLLGKTLQGYEELPALVKG